MTKPKAPHEKKRIGRPPGAKNKAKATEPEKMQEKTQEQPTAAPPTNIDEEIKRMRTEYTEQKVNPDGPEKKAEEPAAAAPTVDPVEQLKEAMPFKISGYLALVVVDAMFPAGIAFFLKRKGWTDITSDQLTLTDQQIEKLTPVADECVKQLIVNPWVMFFVATASMYMGNIPPKPKKKAVTEHDLQDAIDSAKKELERMKRG
jgi:hypothetical protein